MGIYTTDNAPTVVHVAQAKCEDNSYCQLPYQHSVRWAALPFAASMLMVINLVFMSMKAYITEEFPWAPLPMVPTYTNFSEFNATTLDIFQRRYSRQNVPFDLKYYEDHAERVQITRCMFDLKNSIPLDDCLSSVVLGLPGVPFYGSSMVDLLCSFAAANKSAANWDRKGTCMEQYYGGVKVASQCLWLSYDDSLPTPRSGSYILSFAVARHSDIFWDYVKFIYRLSCSGLVIYLLWTKYYKHCLHLKMTLARFGHQRGHQSKEWSYYIFIGDPTVIILTNPLILILFSVDALTSFTTNMLAAIRVSQFDDTIVLLCSILYLSRGVWFSYLFTAITQILLKRFKIERYFFAVDPTILVVVSTLVSGAISFCSVNTRPIFTLFQSAQTMMVPFHLQSQYHENIPPTFIFVIVAALLPLCYGFLVPLLWYRQQSKVAPIPGKNSFSSPSFNPIKSRAIMALERCFVTYPDCHSTGGTIYTLFAEQPRYRRFPTMSFQGTDCFVLCYENRVLRSRIRLSLLSTMDRNLDDPELAIFDGDTNSIGAYNDLVENTQAHGLVGRNPETHVQLFQNDILKQMNKFVRVAPARRLSGPHSQLIAHYTVRWAYIPSIVSAFLFVNLVSMHIYITDDLPWSPVPKVLSFANFSEFNATTLTLYQDLYTQNTLPSGASYYEDDIHKVQLSRKLLDISKTIPVDECIQSVLLGLPCVVFYSPAMVDLICAFAAANHSVNNTKEWDKRGSCVEEFYFGTKWTTKCVWLTAGNELTSANDSPTTFTLTCASTRYPKPLSRLIQYIFRLLYSGIATYLLWINYYEHCYQLKKTLSIYGHLAKMDRARWSYCIMIGDPTAMILTNPFVGIAFVIDICTSYSSNMLALMRSTQIEDVVDMLSAFLYMSRGVWFSYLSLSLMSMILKRFRQEHRFTEVDPTIMVIVTCVSAGASSYCAAATTLFFNLYRDIKLWSIPQSLQNQRHEGAFALMIYVGTACMMPLVYGFTMPLFTKHNRKFRQKIPQYSSVRYNSLKMRAIFHIQRCCTSSPRCAKFGGTVHLLCAHEPKYKQSPTIDFCGCDCFVLCYRDGVLQYRIRLCLLNTLDRNSDNSELSIVESITPSEYTFHSLVKTSLNSTKYELRRSRVESAWCI